MEIGLRKREMKQGYLPLTSKLGISIPLIASLEICESGRLRVLCVRYLTLLVAFTIFTLLVGITASCAGPSQTLTPNIGDIMTQPAAYEGMIVTIDGKYQGWKGGVGGEPPVSRSDWLVEDATGCIYVNGKIPQLDPVEDIGTPVEVKGMVRVTDEGVPYIEAESINMEKK